MASRAETSVDHPFGYLDNENVIKGNSKNALAYGVLADPVTNSYIQLNNVYLPSDESSNELLSSSAIYSFFVVVPIVFQYSCIIIILNFVYKYTLDT